MTTMAPSPDQTDWILGVALVLLTGVLFFPFLDTYYDYGFEPDLYLDVIRAYSHFFGTGSPAKFTPFALAPPYLDGQYSVYAAAARGVGRLAALGWLPSVLPGPYSHIHYAIRHVNLAFRAGASMFAYLFLKDLSKNRAVASLLALIVILNPVLVDIDLIRQDHFFLLPMFSTLYFSLRILRGDIRPRTLSALGLSGGVALSSKLSGISMAGAALVALLMQRSRLARADWWWAGLSAGSIFILLDLRILFTIKTFPHDLWLKVAHLGAWNRYVGPRPYLQYHWNDLLRYGWLFPTLALVAVVIVSIEAWLTRERIGTYLGLIFIFFSVLLIPAYKYPRGGYLLLPVYLGFIAFCLPIVVARIRAGCRWSRSVTTAVFASLLLFPIAKGWTNYENLEALMERRPKSIFITRVLPRRWLDQHARPGTRLAVSRDLSYAMPPIWDLGFPLVDGFFPFAALQGRALLSALPPTIEDLRRTVDVVVSSDELERGMAAQFRGPGLEEQGRSWARFFSDLRQRYLSISFRAETRNYYVERVTLYIVRPESLRFLPTRSVSFGTDPAF